MKTIAQSSKKLNNEIFKALKKINVIDPNKYHGIGFRSDLFDFADVLDHYNWNLKDEVEYPDFDTLRWAINDIAKKNGISEYQKFCFVKLSEVLYDARLLYENNIIDFAELRKILVRIKKDVYKRFKRIEKSYSKKELKDNKLNSDSLLLLQAKLAILENEN